MSLLEEIDSIVLEKLVKDIPDLLTSPSAVWQGMARRPGYRRTYTFIGPKLAQNMACHICGAGEGERCKGRRIHKARIRVARQRVEAVEEKLSPEPLKGGAAYKQGWTITGRIRSLKSNLNLPFSG